jgi:hypothetical protein
VVEGSNNMRRGIYWSAVQQLIVKEIVHRGVGLSCVDRIIHRIDLRISIILGNCKVLSDRTD